MVLLYLIEFLHQTTTALLLLFLLRRCILLNFYIKPQLAVQPTKKNAGCILLNFYIKPQLIRLIQPVAVGCILLNFYIKPQQYGESFDYLGVVSY